MSDWKTSGRTICPRCGATNWKRMSAFRVIGGQVVTFIVLSGIILILGLIFFPLLFLLIFPVIFLIYYVIKPPKWRQCKDCGKAWQYYREITHDEGSHIKIKEEHANGRSSNSASAKETFHS